MSSEQHRLVHLDLKGAPPKVAYLEKVFSSFRQWGATGILLEWEDTFPYRGDIGAIGSLSAGSSGVYSEEEAMKILQLASYNGLIVIPLIQTFGHLEFVLKHDKFRMLREMENYPSSMCPSKPSSLDLVKSMIKQVVDFHPDIQHLHIGADEVWHLGLCSTCKQRMKTQDWDNHDLFLDHIVNIAQFIHETYPSLHIVMWDDMLRGIPASKIKNAFCEPNINSFLEPMVWQYSPMEAFLSSDDIWAKYSSVFVNVWVASAFKGATRSNQILPVIQNHVGNHEMWLRVCNKEMSRFQNFKGLALTGWSRFDHYATLCELLPAALPSLALCLKMWQGGEFSPEMHLSVSESLGYKVALPLNPYPRPQPVEQNISFPGSAVLVGVEWLANLLVKFQSIVESDRVETWLNSWQITNNFTSPMQVESLIPLFKDTLSEFVSFETYMHTQLEDVFYTHTIEEWFGTLVEPKKMRLQQLIKDAETQMKVGGHVKGYQKVL